MSGAAHDWSRGLLRTATATGTATGTVEIQDLAPKGQPGDPPCPDIGTRLARFLVLRAIGRSYDDLARAFNLSYEQARLLLARHGEPPRLAGAQAADMKRALDAAQMATPVAPFFATRAASTHAAFSHGALETNQEPA